MRPEMTKRPPLPFAGLLMAMVVLIALQSAACASSDSDGKGVSAQTNGAGDAYSGKNAAPAKPLRPLDNQVFRELTIMSSDVEQAPEAIRLLRGYVAQKPGEQTETFLHRLLVRALTAIEAPAGEIIEEADLTGPGMPQSGSIRSLFYLEVAETLLRRDEAAATALAYSQKAIDEIPPDETRPEVAGYARGILGRAQLASGDCRPAIATLAEAVSTSPDSQSVLQALGAAYEKCNEPKAAIDHYVRSLGVYGSTDSSAAAALRRLYAATHGSLKGLDAQIAKSYDASMRLQVFDARRYEAPMPSWSLENGDGRTIASADLAGKILVLDFWGSWCGPCRMELPHFQAMYEKFRDQGVVFYGVNWERVDRSKRKAQAMAYMQANGFDFPNVFDLDDKVPFDFQVNSYPTVFIVDSSGRIRYRNIGFSDSISDIMTLQIESLIAEQKKSGRAKK